LTNEIGFGIGSGLFAADYVSGCGWLFSQRSESGQFEPNASRLLSSDLDGIVDAVQGPEGDLYWLGIWGPMGGTINRLRVGVSAKIEVQFAEFIGGSASLDASSSSTSLNDTNLMYYWDLDDDGVFTDAFGPTVTVPNVTGKRNVNLRVEDRAGRFDIKSAAIGVGKKPIVSITVTQRPQLESGEYLNGTSVELSANIDDDTDFPQEKIRWLATIEHCGTPQTCHSHFVGSATGPTFSVRTDHHEDNAFLRIYAYATDQTGLTGEAFVDLLVSKKNEVELTSTIDEVKPRDDLFNVSEIKVLSKTLQSDSVVVHPWRKIDLEIQFEKILEHFDMHLSEAIIRTYDEILKDRYKPHYMSILNGFTNLLLLERDRAIEMNKIKKKPIVKFAG
jgi:hypothetical protein